MDGQTEWIQSMLFKQGFKKDLNATALSFHSSWEKEVSIFFLKRF